MQTLFMKGEASWAPAHTSPAVILLVAPRRTGFSQWGWGGLLINANYRKICGLRSMWAMHLMLGELGKVLDLLWQAWAILGNKQGARDEPPDYFKVF